MSITRTKFGNIGPKVCELFEMRSSKARVLLTNYGARITQLHLPDRSSKWANVVAGFESLHEYVNTPQYFGCTIGRVANRIAKAEFELDGGIYKLAANNGPNCLHGGIESFDRQVWDSEVSAEGTLEFHYSSAHMEEGFPGLLKVSVKFALLSEDELLISYRATTDRPTLVNLTNHSFFNLAGIGNGTILAHELMIQAERYTPVDDKLIPTGELRAVEGTPFDFRIAKAIAPSIDQVAGGFDHNFVLAPKQDQISIELRDPSSGRTLSMQTSQPGVQLYTGNFFDGSLSGIGGSYARHSSMCLETQHFPDSINQPSFPSITLRPGEVYNHHARWKFGVR